jgi:hypothetical protein
MGKAFGCAQVAIPPSEGETGESTNKSIGGLAGTLNPPTDGLLERQARVSRGGHRPGDEAGLDGGSADG